MEPIYGTFDGKNLVECYAPPNLHSVMPGNRVMLRSGGPEMIVIKQVGHNMADVRWGDNGEFTHIFYLDCLTCFGAK